MAYEQRIGTHRSHRVVFQILRGVTCRKKHLGTSCALLPVSLRQELTCADATV